MLRNSIRAILFDLDGVLVDSRVPIARSINFALERCGVAPFPEAELHGYIGPPLREAFLAVLERRGAAASLADRCVDAYRERYRWACLEETALVDGVADSLARIGARYRLAVATSKPQDFARSILENLGLGPLFEQIVGPSLEARAEQKSDTVRRALAELGLGAQGGEAAAQRASKAEGRGSRRTRGRASRTGWRQAPARSDGAPRAAIVGDRHHDVEAGRSNGLVTIGVTWGVGDREELRAAGVDFLVDIPAELVALAAPG